MVEFLNFYHLKYNNFIRLDIDLLEAVVFFFVDGASGNSFSVRGSRFTIGSSPPSYFLHLFDGFYG